MAQNRNLFRLTRFILLRLPGVFKLFGGLRTAKKRLLIIKTDAIGDYILFRNFIEVVKRSEQYRDYHLTLLANPLCKDVAGKYDGQFVNKFIFANTEKIYDSPLEVLKLGWQLFRDSYEVVLQPAYSRTFMTDGLAALAAAKQTIGFESDTERIREKLKKKTDRFYTRRIALPASVTFEFERTKFFFESLLKQELPINGPSLPPGNGEKQGIVIAPGAGVMKRSWEPQQFVELIKLIKAQSSEPIILAGGPSEIAAGNYIIENLPNAGMINRINQTPLTELVELIANSKLVVANETSTTHIAAATQTTSVCILGGGHFGRFAPYPGSIANAPICVYHPMDCFECNWECIYKTEANEPFPCISKVDVAAVWDEVQKHL